MNYRTEFKNGALPDIDKFDGEYEIRFMLPLLDEVRLLDQVKTFPSGLPFNDAGFNSILMVIFFEFGHFQISKGKSLIDEDLDVIIMDYNNQANSNFVRGFREEFRQIGDGYYIGRLVYNLLGNPIVIAYITMKKGVPPRTYVVKRTVVEKLWQLLKKRQKFRDPYHSEVTF